MILERELNLIVIVLRVLQNEPRRIDCLQDIAFKFLKLAYIVLFWFLIQSKAIV